MTGVIDRLEKAELVRLKETGTIAGRVKPLGSADKLEETTRDLCERIMRTPPMVQWISKRIMRAALDSSLETTMVLTSNAGGILQGSEDAQEARRAFLEKRRPVFKGR